MMAAVRVVERVQNIIQFLEGSLRGMAGRPIIRRAGFCCGFAGAGAAGAAGLAAGAAGGVGSAILAVLL